MPLVAAKQAVTASRRSRAPSLLTFCGVCCLVGGAQGCKGVVEVDGGVNGAAAAAHPPLVPVAGVVAAAAGAAAAVARAAAPPVPAARAPTPVAAARAPAPVFAAGARPARAQGERGDVGGRCCRRTSMTKQVRAASWRDQRATASLRNTAKAVPDAGSCRAEQSKTVCSMLLLSHRLRRSRERLRLLSLRSRLRERRRSLLSFRSRLLVPLPSSPCCSTGNDGSPSLGATAGAAPSLILLHATISADRERNWLPDKAQWMFESRNNTRDGRKHGPEAPVHSKARTGAAERSQHALGRVQLCQPA
jgi:hypothetical protein